MGSFEFGRGHRSTIALAVAVLAAGIAASAVVAGTIRANDHSDAAQVLDRQAAIAGAAVAAEAKRYQDTLRGLAAAIGAQPDLRAADVAAITAPLTGSDLPGASGVAIVVPARDEQLAAVQAYWRARGATGLKLEPFGHGSEHLFGVIGRQLDGRPNTYGHDVSQSEEPTAALLEARRTGQVAVSDTYVLFKDRNLPPDRRQLSFVMVAPIYGPGRGAFKGWVTMGMRGRDFIAETLRTSSQELIDVSLFAETAGGATVKVAGLGKQSGGGGQPREVRVPIGQGYWRLEVRSSELARHLRGNSHPDLVIGIGGALISVLLAVLVLALGSERDRAKAQVERATAELRAASEHAGGQAELLGAIMDSIADGVGVVDEQGAFLLHNPAARRYVGVVDDLDDPAGWQEHDGIYRPDGVTPFPTDELPLVRALGGDTAEQVEMVIRNPGQPDGLFISVSAKPLTGAGRGAPWPSSTTSRGSAGTPSAWPPPTPSWRPPWRTRTSPRPSCAPSPGSSPTTSSPR